ncbi:hypothetical protein E7Z59_05600 [Robertkochia marina]|uniref:Uncharacterized protein n=1 Tax=Robertkochia marina TaxID=1227945 RepID=A0A4S3M3P5_9FLAO|nr:hypothetical protein [Robertkochia marina]THD69802.1 hypothetical protein E7Z59_05600 [Robertkochia marina]TRZ46854.1 hypothetical protein D3A96_04610 [Robertkochia marina]
MRSIRIFPILLITTVLLLIPFIAMQFTAEVNWSGFDFMIMAILLTGCGLTIEVIRVKTSGGQKRVLLTLLAILLFLLLWAELAIGVFNSPIAGS